MAEHFYYRELKNYADKEHKFRQRKSLGKIEAAGGNVGPGVCATACMLWVAEKLEHNKTNVRHWKETFRDGNQEDQHNEDIMLHAYQLQQQHYLNQGGDVTQLETTLGLNKAPSGAISITAADEPGQFSEKLAKAINQLQAGQAATFEVNIGQAPGGAGSHMIAAYKSRGGSLHFFDPNAGIYNVHLSRVPEFTRGLERAYGNRGWEEISPFRRPHLNNQDWVRIYQRNSDQNS